MARWLATLTKKQIRRGTHRSTRELETAINHYLAVSGQPKRFVWTKTADEMLASKLGLRTLVEAAVGRRGVSPARGLGDGQDARGETIPAEGLRHPASPTGEAGSQLWIAP